MNDALGQVSTSLLTTLLSHLDNEIIYCEPFWIFSKANRMIFKSTGFLELEGKVADLSETIAEKVLNSRQSSFEYAGFKVRVQKISTDCLRDELYLVFIKKAKKTRRSDNYSIVRCCHDIQEPLRNISNFLQIIYLQIKKRQFDNCCKYIEFTIENILTVKDFVAGILRENCISSHSRFSFAEIIKKVRDVLSSQITERNCVLQTTGTDKCINGDYHEIFSLLKNLVENSIKHSKADKLLIGITVSKCSNDLIKITFKDNGAQLQNDHVERINKALSEDSAMAGFGIHICKTIVKNHAGSMKLVNGEGCVYEITLPIVIGEIK